MLLSSGHAGLILTRDISTATETLEQTRPQLPMVLDKTSKILAKITSLRRRIPTDGKSCRPAVQMCKYLDTLNTMSIRDGQDSDSSAVWSTWVTQQSTS